MTGLLRLFLLAILLLPAIPQFAAAELVDLVWTGATQPGSNDGLGLFGPAGPVTAGTLYTARYRFDTSIGFFENLTNGSQEVAGGTFYSPALPIPLISADVTINGLTVVANGDHNSQYFRQTGQGASQIATNAQRSPTAPIGGELFQRVFRIGNFYTLPLAQPGEFDFTASDGPGGEFLHYNRDSAGNLSGPTTQIALVPSHLSITVAVPEPASFAFAIFGVFGATQMLRRRRVGSRCTS